MTKEEAKEFYPILQAFAEGKVIECRTKPSALSKSWQDMNEWTEMEELEYWNNIEYRIKPDSKAEAKYRSFANAEECWNEMKKHHPFGWIHVTDDNLYHNIIMLAPEQGCHEAYIRIGNCTVRGLEETFRIATFADGQPFGVKIEEE